MKLFICPSCGEELNKTQQQYTCPNKHNFDIASQGYVNLLLANQKNSKNPGDDKEMVNARTRFLSAGYYDILMQALCDTISNLSGESLNYLDCGCGEGYYSDAIVKFLKTKNKNVSAAAIDISKKAVQKAAKRNKDIECAVASIYKLPIKNASIDIITNIFAPFSEQEYARVLKSNGFLIYVVPAPDHLWQMKEMLYENPYENERISPVYEGFDNYDKIYVESEIFIDKKELLSDLFSMTPYFWHTPKDGIKKLEETESLKIKISFDIHILKRQ